MKRIGCKIAIDDFGTGYSNFEYIIKLNIDIPFEKRGLVPSAATYDKWYGHNRWAATTVISNAIGQGEILMTPLQMANLAVVIANGDGYREPHFVRARRQ